MTHELLAMAQWVIDANTALVGVEGVLVGAALFSSLLLVMRHKARKAARQ